MKTPEQKISEKIALIDKIADEIPGVVIIHAAPDYGVAYMSSRGLRNLGVTIDQLKEMGPLYHELYFNKEDAADYVPKIRTMLEQRDPENIVTFFQQVKNRPEAPWTWHLSTSKILLQDDDGAPLLAITVAQPIDPLHHVTAKVSRLLKENDFLRANYSKFASLTRREKEILHLLAHSKSAAEIAEQLFVSAHTVESHRKNIRKKLGINTAYDLEEYARAFDLL